MHSRAISLFRYARACYAHARQRNLQGHDLPQPGKHCRIARVARFANIRDSGRIAGMGFATVLAVKKFLRRKRFRGEEFS
jgi:hypothetical protein